MLVIEGKAFVDGRLVECGIGVEDGKVVRIAKILRGDRTMRFPGTLILPGAVDAHVHMRDPGGREKEDFGSGTEAAACGGVTTVVDMPNNAPPSDSPERLARKLGAIRTRAHVDFALLGGLREGVDVLGMAPTCAGYKLYMGPTTGGLQVEDYGSLPALFEAVAEAGRPVSVHCEHAGFLRTGGAKDLPAYEQSRPAEAEVEAIRLLKRVRGSATAHVAHLSSRLSPERLGGDLTSEVTPHHLLLTANDELGALAKVNPPLRGKADREALWEALRAGTIDVIASDHAPHTAEEKEEFETAPPGMPGVETMLPLLFARVRSGHLSLERLVNALCERPAEVFGLRKGRIAVGRDADLVVVNPRDETRIREDDLHSRCGWTAFAGRSGIFPQTVFLRGEPIAADRELKIGRAGRFLEPAA
jgi:dihydroorotase